MPAKPHSILIVKMSSMGDIIQTFHVLDYLKEKCPQANIDWVVEEALASLVAAHPHVRNVISIDLKGMKKKWNHFFSWKNLFKSICCLRKKKYDVLFDLQGNCKSGLITWFSRAKSKVGFGFNSVREKPNVLFTNVRVNVLKQTNIRKQHLQIVQEFFQDFNFGEMLGIRLNLPEQESQKIQNILSHPCLQTSIKIMVCPGSKWINKQLSVEVLVDFLMKIEKQYNASFLLVWGADSEKIYCEEVHAKFLQKSCVIEKLSVTAWQNLMNEVNLVIAVDSSALHLCGTTQTPSFSLFGPTSSDIFRPIGSRHFSLQGVCPYGKTFEKTCPILRTCPTGACIRNLTPEKIFESFSYWWEQRINRSKST
jgi:heptosyltransferase-1